VKLTLTPKFILAFLALTFLMHEAHEIVHTTVGRIICGCWGERDFNVWGLCTGCPEREPLSIISTFAGPIFTFTMIWIGAFLIDDVRTVEQKTFGFSLIFANTPFARIMTASLGGGDEVWGLGYLMNDHSIAWMTGFLLVLIITIFPIVKAFKLIKNKRKLLWFLLFFLAPTFIDILVVLGILNTLLQQGLLSSYWILGSPMIVSIWTFIVAFIFLLTRRNIYTLANTE